MKKEELEVFYLYDKHNYLVNKNPILHKILKKLSNKYEKQDLQEFILKLISWYVVKYSDRFLDSLFGDKDDIDATIVDIMSIEQLQKSYSTFEENLFSESAIQDEKIVLQKHLIVMAGWGLIYYKKSIPEYGYYRACRLLNDFNSFYSWNLPVNVYKKIFDRDYSPNNEENKKKLEMKKYVQEKKIFSRNGFYFRR